MLITACPSVITLIDAEKISRAQLILVTAMTPTPAGEGKTTMSIGLSDGLNKLGKKAIAVLREPSVGPVFGNKGGATGGGHSQVGPMVDINLHFTGDMHALTSANNLLAALVDNHLYWGNALGIDPRTNAAKGKQGARRRAPNSRHHLTLPRKRQPRRRNATT